MIPLASVGGRVPHAVCYSGLPLVTAGSTVGDSRYSPGLSMYYGATAQSSTGYVTVEWWNGTKTTYGSGNTLADIGISSGWVDTANTKRIVLYASNASGGQRGFIRNLSVEEWQLTRFDVTTNTELVGLKASRNRLTSLDLSPMRKLEFLHFRSNLNTSLDVSRCPALKVLYTGGGRHSTTGAPNLDPQPEIHPRRPSALTTLTFGSANSSIRTLIVQGSGVTTMNLTHLTGLFDLKCNDNPLSSLTMPTGGFTFGTVKNRYGSTYSGCILSVSNTDLDAASLESMYTALPTVPVGQDARVSVVGTDGVNTEEPDHTIATNKGYVVYSTNQF